MDKLKSVQSNFDQEIRSRDRHVQELINNLESLSAETRDTEGLRQENGSLKALIDQLRAENSHLKAAQSDLDRLRTLQGSADQDLLART